MLDTNDWPQTRKINHPRRRAMATSRISEVKAPQHRETARYETLILTSVREYHSAVGRRLLVVDHEVLDDRREARVGARVRAGNTRIGARVHVMSNVGVAGAVRAGAGRRVLNLFLYYLSGGEDGG